MFAQALNNKILRLTHNANFIFEVFIEILISSIKAGLGIAISQVVSQQSYNHAVI